MNILVKTAVTIGAMAVAVKAIDSKFKELDKESKELYFDTNRRIDMLHSKTLQTISVLNAKTNVSLTDSGLMND